MRPQVESQEGNARAPQLAALLEANAETLGFGERAAQKLIKGAEANPNLGSDLSAKEALLISRGIWDHADPPAGNPQGATPRPTLEPTIAVLVDAAMQIAGADVVLAHIKNLNRANTVTLEQFKHAACAVAEKLAAQA
jgi:hypothetical protein